MRQVKFGHKFHPGHPFINGDDVVLASDFDRILAERAALQLRLSAVEEENDRLRQLLMASKEHVEFSVGYWASSDKSDQDLIESICALEKQP